MNIVTPEFYGLVNKAIDVLAYVLHLCPPHVISANKDDAIMARLVLEDARSYIYINLFRETPSDLKTLLPYNKVSIRRLKHAGTTVRALAYGTGSFQRICRRQEYRQTVSTIKQLVEYYEERLPDENAA